MTRSTNPNWTQTAGQLCHSAARELGAIGLSDTLEASELEEMTTRLNSMLATWSIEANLFREARATIELVATQRAATLPSDVRDISGVAFVESDTYSRPLAPWNRSEYYSIPNRAQAGKPTIYYYSQQLGGDQLWLWPVPDEPCTLELDYSRSFNFVESPDQELDLPAEWHQAALYGLASRCAAIFGATKLDPAAVVRCDQQSKATYDRLLDADRPDTYRFEYDSPVRIA